MLTIFGKRTKFKFPTNNFISALPVNPKNNLNTLFALNNTCKSFCYIWNKLVDPDKQNKRNSKNKYDYVNIEFGNGARKLITSGIMEVSETVAKTYGPLGKNVAISERRQPIIVTKDGVTVAKYIKFSSRKKNLGCRLLNSIAGSTNIHAGDGTTTSTVLAAEIVKKGNNLVSLGFHPLEVKKGIQQASKSLIDYLEKTKSYVKTKQDLWNLAMITTNKNTEISEVISEALIQGGEKAIIQIEESQTGATHLKIEEGMFLNNGVASSEFLTFSPESNLIYDNPLILVVRNPITEISQIVKTMEYIKSIERPLVIFSPEMKKEPLSLLLYNMRKNNINCLAVNVPDYVNDESNQEILNDICTMTGAKLCESRDLEDIDVESNILFEENFGSCRRIRSNEMESVLMGVKGDKKQIQEMLSRLDYYSKNENQPGYRSYYQERLSRLQGKSCTIYVGGITPVEITENRDKIVDALNSCQTSLQYGVVSGGGNALIHGLKILEMLKYETKDLDVGLNIFYHAIINTLKHLFKNSKVIAEIIIDKVKSKSNENPLYGYDIVTEKYSDNMIEEGVLDSYNTITTAIEDAVSVASLLITTECVVYKEYDYEPPPLDAFRNRIKTDPEYRAKVQKEFHSDGPDDDMKLFSSVI